MVHLVHLQVALVQAVLLQDLVVGQVLAALVPVHVLAQVHLVPVVLQVLLTDELKLKQSKI